jgi:hypothetical protein
MPAILDHDAVEDGKPDAVADPITHTQVVALLGGVAVLLCSVQEPG